MPLQVPRLFRKAVDLHKDKVAERGGEKHPYTVSLCPRLLAVKLMRLHVECDPARSDDGDNSCKATVLFCIGLHLLPEEPQYLFMHF